MSQLIHWQVFLQAKSKDTAERLLQHFARALGQECSTVECEPYWKDPRLFRAVLTTPIAAEDFAGAVLSSLQLGSCVARNWMVGGPQSYEGNLWEFAGSALAETVVVPGVKHIDFQVSNLPKSPPQSILLHDEIGKN